MNAEMKRNMASAISSSLVIADLRILFMCRLIQYLIKIACIINLALPVYEKKPLITAC